MLIKLQNCLGQYLCYVSTMRNSDNVGVSSREIVGSSSKFSLRYCIAYCP